MAERSSETSDRSDRAVDAGDSALDRTSSTSESGLGTGERNAVQTPSLPGLLDRSARAQELRTTEQPDRLGSLPFFGSPTSFDFYSKSAGLIIAINLAIEATAAHLRRKHGPDPAAVDAVRCAPDEWIAAQDAEMSGGPTQRDAQAKAHELAAILKSVEGELPALLGKQTRFAVGPVAAADDTISFGLIVPVYARGLSVGEVVADRVPRQDGKPARLLSAEAARSRGLPTSLTRYQADPVPVVYRVVDKRS